MPRILSLLPAATEMVCALGGESDLVGISHECDTPAAVNSLPRVTSSRLAPAPTSDEIHQQVQGALQSALSPFAVQPDAIRRLAPEIILTQDLCEICAVSFADVERELAELLQRDTTVVRLSPDSLAGILEDVQTVARAIGRSHAGADLAAAMQRRFAEVGRRVANEPERAVLTIEWLQPVMLGGTWMPELCALANARALGAIAGQPAPIVDFEQLAQWDPEVVLFKPCGFALPRTLRELAECQGLLPWSAWQNLKGVFVADGNAYFNRPGPRIVESLEILAAVVHPRVNRDVLQRFEGEVTPWFPPAVQGRHPSR